jgi:hypothetical protein
MSYELAPRFWSGRSCRAAEKVYKLSEEITHTSDKTNNEAGSAMALPLLFVSIANLQRPLIAPGKD